MKYCVLLHAAKFTTGYVRLVGQEPALGRCVLNVWDGLEGYAGLGFVPRGR